MDDDRPAELRVFIAMLAAAGASGRPRPAALRWPNHAALVLALGRPWAAAPRPPGIRKGRPRQCFRNSFLLAERRPELGLRYCEGYASSDLGIPTLHAWCVDPDDQVVDPTWPEPAEGAYFGLALPLDLVRATVVRTGCWGVLANDYLDDLRLLRTGVVVRGPNQARPNVSDRLP